MPDRIDSHVRLKAKTRIPLSGARARIYALGLQALRREGRARYPAARHLLVRRPSETLKITALATTHDLIVIPHGHSTPIGIHYSVAQSPIHTPYQEYLVKWNEINMHFLRHPLRPEAGVIRMPEAPGAGMALDPEKIEEEVELTEAAGLFR